MAKTCGVCSKPINGKAAILPGGDRTPAHFACWKLLKQREKWNEPSATRLGEARRLHRAAAVRAAQRGGDDRHSALD